MKYIICKEDKIGFSFTIHYYYENVCEIGDIEVYKTGKIYFKDFPIKSGMSIKDIQKALKIAKKS